MQPLTMATEASPPRVSIVIPAYNRQRYIGRTLGSVLAQTVTDWELIVFDDGSTDDTRAIAERHAELDARIKVMSGVNGGVARARNRGLAATDPRSEFVVFLDSDDRWFPDTLYAMTAVLDARPDLVSVYGLARCIDADDQPVPGDDLPQRMRERFEFRGWNLVPILPSEPTTFAGLIHHNYTVTTGLHLVRRSVIDRVGAFDPETDPADDWDFALRICRNGPIGFLDRLVLEWRRHPETLTNTSPRWRHAYYRVQAKALTAPANTPEERRLVRVAYLSRSRDLLIRAWSDGRKLQLGAAGRDAARAVHNTALYGAAAVSLIATKAVAAGRAIRQ
jgi:glycosyltransferase involved in cell wall biosynthesis